MINKYRRLKEKEMIRLEGKYINNEPHVVAIVKRFDEVGDPLPPTENVYNEESIRNYRSEYMKNTTKERERIMGELKNLDKNIEMLTADFDEFEADFIATKNAFDEKINEATSFVNARVKQLEKTAQENPGQEKQVLRSDKSDTK
jgi:hypothetical protein